MCVCVCVWVGETESVRVLGCACVLWLQEPYRRRHHANEASSRAQHAGRQNVVCTPDPFICSAAARTAGTRDTVGPLEADDRGHACACVDVLKDITTEPHAHDISADIVRVWLSGYILQQDGC